MPTGYYMNGCSVNVVHLHRLNLAVNQTSSGYIKNLLSFYPWETAASIAAGQAQRAKLYTSEIL